VSETQIIYDYDTWYIMYILYITESLKVTECKIDKIYACKYSIGNR